MVELSENDKQRLLKAKILERFSLEKKDPVRAVGLCVLVGFTGLHRFYLGQSKQAVAAMVIGTYFLFVGVLAFVDKDTVLTLGRYQAFAGYGIFVAIESFLTRRAVTRVNERIRESIVDDLTP